MRVCAVLLLLALCARAEGWDSLKKAIAEERFEEALQTAEAARAVHKNDGLLLLLRAQAVVGVARDLQREQGYAAALDFFEKRLDHELSVYWYGRTCAWAGEEERGIAALRRCDVPPAQRLYPELSLLQQLRRYDELVERAKVIGGQDAADWIEWAHEESALHDRLAGRARVSLILSLAVIGGAVAGVLITFCRRPAT